jgi:hypothetical protein
MMKNIAVILVALVSASPPKKQIERKSESTRVDQLLDRSDFRGVASVHVESERFIALWTGDAGDQTLEIYTMKKYPTVRLVNQFTNPEVPFQSLTAVQDGAAGFLLRRTAPEGWFGGTIVYFYVRGTFRKVFEYEDEAELLDLTGEYQGGKDDPACKVKIIVWKDDKYQYLMTVPLSQLFSPATRKRILQFSGYALPRP